MYDVNFQPLVVSDREGVDQYAAQDLETQEVGDAVPFTSDFQSGFVYLAYDFIAPTPTEFNDYDDQDMEGLDVGVITQIPATVLTTEIPSPVYFLAGTITTSENYAADDMETYSDGALPLSGLNNSFSSGYVTLAPTRIY